MSRTEYLEELEVALRKLPPNEVEEALQYYEEYFDERGPEGEQQALIDLGPPQKVAQKILADSSIKETESLAPSLKKGALSVWAIVLGIFAAPIGVPIAIAIAAVFLAVIIAIIAVFGALLFAGGACVVAGIAILLPSFFALIIHFWTGVCGIGASLISIGLGLLLCAGTIKVLRLFFVWVRQIGSKMATRRAKNEG